jgi:hypothetical protein
MQQDKAFLLLYAQLAQWLERVIAVLSSITRSLVRVRHWAFYRQLFSFLLIFNSRINPRRNPSYFSFLLLSKFSFVNGKRAKKMKITLVGAYLRTLYESKEIRGEKIKGK